MALDNKQIHAILEQELALSEGEDHGDLERHREQALRYFQNLPKGDEIPGRSAVNSGDVGDMTEAVLSELLPLFEGEGLVMFEPTSAEDEDQARLESSFVQHILARQGFYTVAQEAMKDAILMRNGFIKCTIEESEQRREQPVDGLTALQMTTLGIQLEQQGYTVSYPDEQTEEGYMIGSIVATRINREFRLSSPPPENIRYSSEHQSSSLQGIRFFAERMYMTRSELRKLGYDAGEIDQMQASQMQSDGAEDARRSQNNTQQHQAVQRVNDNIETWDVYVQIDENENGRARLMRYHWIPDSPSKIYDSEQASMIPYATGSPFIFPHRITGWSLFDKLKSIEDAKRFSLRQMLDNMNNMNNTRKRARKGAVIAESLLNSRPGGVIWCNDPANDVVDEQKVSIVAESVELLNYLDKMRTEKGGAALDQLNPEFQLPGQNAGDQGVGRLLDGKERLTSMMARNFAESLVKDTWRIAHAMMREFMPGELNAKLQGIWQQTDPSQWPEREHLTVHIGMSSAERIAKIAATEKLIEGQRNMVEFGFDGTMVTEKHIYNAMVDWMQLNRFTFAEQYLQDPESQEAQQARQQKQQQMEAQQAQQADLQEQLIGIQNRLEKYKIDTEFIGDMVREQVRLAVEEAKLTLQVDAEFNALQEGLNNVTNANQGAGPRPNQTNQAGAG